MTSYFEITGQVIELLDDSNDVQFALGMVSAKEHREARAENKESLRSLESFSSSRRNASEGKDSLGEHALKMWTHNLRSFADESGRRKITLLKNPYLLTIWGIGQGLEMIGANYDYFIKGESHDW